LALQDVQPQRTVLGLTVIDFNQAARSDQPKPGHIDVDDIRDRLHANPAGFVQWLFSGRAIVGKKEARIGDIYGTAGESLSISLHGPDAGLWHDHATGQGGDLISLYTAYMNYGSSNFQLALKEIAAEYLGDPVEVSRPAWNKTAIQRIEEKKEKLGDKPKAENLELGAPVENYPYHDRAGNILAVVRRYEPGGTDENGKPRKTFRASPNFPNPRPLYRVPQIIQATHIVLTEGERKADALASLGIEATTAMGGSNTKIEMVDWQPLAGKTVTLWPDKDQAGEDYMRRVAPILTGLGCRVAIVTPPADKPAKWDAYDCVAEGGAASELINSAQPVSAMAPQPFYKLYTLEELETLPPPKWILDGLLVENGLTLFWAGSDQYKTFVAIDMAMSIATGRPWHGRAVKQGRVIYVAAEDESGVKMRMVGWRETRGKTDNLPRPDILIQRDGVSLATEEGEKLIQSILAISEETRPVLIVIDTLQRTFGGANENQTQDMGQYILAADKLKNATGANVMIIHHSGRNSDRERGNIALRGACNTIFTVERSDDKITITNEPPKGKQKNATAAKDMHFRMQQVEFEYLGERQTTLIPMADENPKEAKSKPAKQPDHLTKNQTDVLSIIEKMGPVGPIRIQSLTRLPKSTVHSVLKKLSELNFVFGPSSDGLYEVASDASDEVRTENTNEIRGV
jgi:hypothetical protein